jgi:DNA-binding MarR family transcriptional regulator
MGSDTPPAVTAADYTDLLRALGAVHRSMRSRLSPHFLEEHGLDLRHFILLRQLDLGVAHPGDLARAFAETASQISRRLDRLEGQGLVARSLDPADSRRVRVELTPAGRSLLAAMDEQAAAILGPALARFGAARRRALVDGLRSLAEALAAEPDR